jgi:hypothetical protein
VVELPQDRTANTKYRMLLSKNLNIVDVFQKFQYDGTQILSHS